MHCNAHENLQPKWTPSPTQRCTTHLNWRRKDALTHKTVCGHVCRCYHPSALLTWHATENTDKTPHLHGRDLPLVQQASTGEAGDGDLGRSRKGTRVRRHYAGLLMSYEWMIEVPQTLGPAWRVMARPEGKRCLLIASKCALPGKTSACSMHCDNVITRAQANFTRHCCRCALDT